MIAVLYMCTGVYDVFWPSFYRSAEQYFCPETPKKYIVFTDSKSIEERHNILVMNQDDMGWPLNTLLRYRMFLRAGNMLDRCEHIVFFNSNAVFQSAVTTGEFFGDNKDLVACLHPAFFSEPPEAFTYERRTSSMAYVHTPHRYFCGGLMGGRPKPFLDACERMAACIDVDLGNGIMAVWHDESHWNAYINNSFESLHPRLHILDPSYMYPEGWDLPYSQIILLRDKSQYFDDAKLKGRHPKTETPSIYDRMMKRVVRLLRQGH